MIKRILVPLDPSPYTQNAIKIACDFAHQNGAELTGLAVLDTPGIIDSTGLVGVGGGYYAKHLMEHKENEAYERIQSLLADFSEKCEEAGVAHHEADSQGVPGNEIINQSIYYDLVVLGMRTFFHFETDDKPGDTLTRILNHTITPVYAVPQEVNWPNSSNERIKVLIAFDGSLLAARALQQFVRLSFFKRKEVVLLMSGKSNHEVRRTLGDANTYLHVHNITNVKMVHTNRSIISVVDEEYLDWADCFVVGAHAQRGLIDFMTGSLTRHLIKVNRKPVLIG